MHSYYFRRITSPTAIVAFFFSLALVVAQSASADEIALASDTKIVASLDLAQFSKTTIGARLVELTTQTAAKEIGTEGENLLVKVRETLGFDPLTEVRTITLAISDLDKFEPNSTSAIVQMGQTTGNLEGLLLALPGYESSEHGHYTLHSAGDEEGKKASGAIHVDDSGNHWVVVSPSKQRVLSLLDTLSGKNTDPDTVAEAPMQVETSLSDGVFASITLLSIPTDNLDDEPFANIVKSLRRATVEVAEGDNVLSLSIDIDSITATRAKQIQQLVQGASAAASLMFDSIDELKDEDLKAAAVGVLESLEVEQEGTKVHLGFDVPISLVIKFLREEADLPL